MRETERSEEAKSTEGVNFRGKSNICENSRLNLV